MDLSIFHSFKCLYQITGIYLRPLSSYITLMPYLVCLASVFTVAKHFLSARDFPFSLIWRITQKHFGRSIKFHYISRFECKGINLCLHQGLLIGWDSKPVYFFFFLGGGGPIFYHKWCEKDAETHLLITFHIHRRYYWKKNCQAKQNKLINIL